MTPNEIKRITEALILSHDAPMSLAQIKAALNIDINNDTLRLLLDEIKTEWSERAVHLTQVATGYRFQTAADVLPYIDRLRAEKPAQYSRAVLETLAIIAYRQPVTRGDIEDIRGVTVSSHIIKSLEERGWIDTVGYREVPGRPALWATTKHFLDDLGLLSLKELPVLLGQEDGDTGQLELVTHEVNDTAKDQEAPESNMDAANPADAVVVDKQQLEHMTESIQTLAPALEVDSHSITTEPQPINLSSTELPPPSNASDRADADSTDADTEQHNHPPIA